jgi:hypothetical protein
MGAGDAALVVDVFWEQPEPEVETDAVVTLAPEQLCMAAAEALFEALHAAAISGVHFAAMAALHEEDLVEAAAAVALSSHANVSVAHVPSVRTASAARTSRECFIMHLQG